MVKFDCSASAAQVFSGWDPQGGHGTARLSSCAEAASHMPQLEGFTTKIYNYVLGGFGEKKAEKKKEDWQQLLAQVPIFKKKRKKELRDEGLC